MKKLKIKKRVGVPETNSSSCHSLTISRDEIYSPHNLPIVDSKLILSPDMFKKTDCYMYSDALNKLGYLVCALKSIRTCWMTDRSTSGNKLLKNVEKVVKDFTGVKEIIYDWDALDYGNNDFIVYDYYRVIDACETLSTIKDFIFNSKSWVWGYYDGDSINPHNYFKKTRDHLTKDKGAVISFHFGGSVGRVDLVLEEYVGLSDCWSFDNYIQDFNSDFLDEILIDQSGPQNTLVNFRSCEMDSNYSRFHLRSSSGAEIINSPTTNQPCVIYLKLGSDLWRLDRGTMLERLTNTTFNSKQLDDIFLVPISINSDEYGKIL